MRPRGPWNIYQMTLRISKTLRSQTGYAFVRGTSNKFMAKVIQDFFHPDRHFPSSNVLISFVGLRYDWIYVTRCSWLNWWNVWPCPSAFDMKAFSGPSYTYIRWPQEGKAKAQSLEQQCKYMLLWRAWVRKGDTQITTRDHHGAPRKDSTSKANRLVRNERGNWIGLRHMRQETAEWLMNLQTRRWRLWIWWLFSPDLQLLWPAD